MLFNQEKNKSGFTLIEVVIALSVIVTGVVTGLTLTTYNLNASVASSDQLTAANLAREGIEAVRQIRDSNWLKGIAWNQGILNAGQYRLIIDFNAASNKFATSTQNVAIDSCAACVLKFDSNTGVFSHTGLGTASQYKRLISIREICWEDPIAEEAVLPYGQTCAANNLELVGWQLESQVKWNQGGQNRSLTVTDRLYNWR